jgi:hypothetical protein
MVKDPSGAQSSRQEQRIDELHDELVDERGYKADEIIVYARDSEVIVQAPA